MASSGRKVNPPRFKQDSRRVRQEDSKSTLAMALGQSDEGVPRRSYLPTAAIKLVGSTKTAESRLGVSVEQPGIGVTRPKTSTTPTNPVTIRAAASALGSRRDGPDRAHTTRAPSSHDSLPFRTTSSITSKTSTTVAQSNARKANTQSSRYQTPQTARGTKLSASREEALRRTSSQSHDLSDLILQLQLVHLQSEQMLHEYSQSLKRSREATIQSAAEQQMIMCANESRQQHGASLAALQSWREDSKGTAGQEVQALSRVMKDLQSCVYDIDSSNVFGNFQTWIYGILRAPEINASNIARDPNMDSADMPDVSHCVQSAEIQRRLQGVIGALQAVNSESELLANSLSFSCQSKLADILFSMVKCMTDIEEAVVRMTEDRQADDLQATLQQLLAISPCETEVKAWRQ